MKKMPFLLSSVAILALVPACNWKFWEKKHAAKPAQQQEAAPAAAGQQEMPAAQPAPAADNK
jgi:hypothetical protein